MGCRCDPGHDQTRAVSPASFRSFLNFVDLTDASAPDDQRRDADAGQHCPLPEIPRFQAEDLAMVQEANRSQGSSLESRSCPRASRRVHETFQKGAWEEACTDCGGKALKSCLQFLLRTTWPISPLLLLQTFTETLDDLLVGYTFSKGASHNAMYAFSCHELIVGLICIGLAYLAMANAWA